MRTVVPFDRDAGVSPVYSGIQEHRQQAVEVRRAPEQEFDAFDNVVLVERKGRNRGRDSEETRDSKHRRQHSLPPEGGHSLLSPRNGYVGPALCVDRMKASANDAARCERSAALEAARILL